MIVSKVKKWGNSLGVIIPAEEINRMKIKAGDTINIDITKKERISAFGMFKGIGGFKREEGLLDRKEFWWLFCFILLIPILG